MTPPLAFIPKPPRTEIHLVAFPLRAYALCVSLGVVLAVYVGERRLTPVAPASIACRVRTSTVSSLAFSPPDSSTSVRVLPSWRLRQWPGRRWQGWRCGSGGVRRC